MLKQCLHFLPAIEASCLLVSLVKVMNEVKAVIFDCDGIVVDTEPATNALLKRDLARRGLNLSDHQLEEMIGGVMADVAMRARALGADLPLDWVETFYAQLYQHLEKGITLIPGILSVLDRLDEKAIPYAIGSNGSEQKMKVTLSQFGSLASRFKAVLSGQTLGKPKPAPDLYLAAAAALGRHPSECAVVEDTPTGARAAKAAGIKCFGYAPAGNARLAAEGAILFRSMDELPDLLGL